MFRGLCADATAHTLVRSNAQGYMMDLVSGGSRARSGSGDRHVPCSIFEHVEQHQQDEHCHGHRRQHRELATARERAEELRLEIERLSQSVRKTRGTGDITETAQKAREQAAPSLSSQLEAILRRGPASIEDLARLASAPVGRVTAALSPHRERVWNSGEGLLRERPMTFQEISAATPVRGGSRERSSTSSSARTSRS